MSTVQDIRLHALNDTNHHSGVPGAVEDNLLSFDANGVLKDSGIASSVILENAKYSRRESVLDVVDCTFVPPTEVSGDRYILDFTVGLVHANWDGASKGDIVDFDGSSWIATTPQIGYCAYSINDGQDVLYTDRGTPEWENRNPKITISTLAPTVNDDNTQGHSRLSEWIQYGANGEIIWKCNDAATGAAIWCVICGEGVDATQVTLHGKVDIVGGSILGRAAFISGGTGAYKPEFQFGDRSGHDSSHLAGLFAETKGNNQNVEIVTKGKLIGTTSNPLDTTAFEVGDRVHLGSNGQWIGETVGGGGSHIELGRILRKHATEGVIEVDIARYVHSIRAWLGGAVELAVGSNDLTTWISLQQFDGTEFGKIYVDGIVVPNIQRMIFTGHTSWTGAGNYYDPTFPDGEFRLLRGGDGDIRSEKVSFTAPQDTGVLSANNIYWIYIDSSGDIQSTTTRLDSLFEDNIVLFQVLYDGTNYLVTKENHPDSFNACISNELHAAYNVVISDSGANMVRVATGSGGSADDRRVKIVGATKLLDHGLNTTIPDSGGAGVSFIHEYTDGSGDWLRDSLDSEFPMEYNNSGTPTALGNLKFGVFRCYVSKDDLNSSTPLYISVMHTAQFNSIALARTAINTGVAEATNELFGLELAQLGYIIVQNNVSGGYIAEVEIQKKTLTGNVTGSGATNIAALISTDTTNFDNILTAGDSNVQNALETLDDHTIASHSDTTATGTQLNTLVGTGNADALHTHDHDVITNNHNLTSDIDHDQLTNFAAAEHFTQGNITTVGTVTVGDVDAVVSDASTTTKGKVELATTAETDTGTDATRAVTPDGLAGSVFGIESFGIGLFESDTSVAVVTGKIGVPAPAKLNGFNIVDVLIAVDSPGITGTTDVQLLRRRGGVEVNVLSVEVTLGDQWYANDGTVNLSNDDIQTGDMFYLKVTGVHSGTPPLGLSGVVSASKP
jgi:hypothetical protein